MVILLKSNICCNSEKDIVYDKYLIPYATVELAIVYLQQDRLSDVKSCIHRAK